MPYEINPDVVWTGDDDEIKIYDSARGEFQTLNSSAAEIWRLVAEGRDLQDVVAELVTRFGNGDPEEAALISDDAREFVTALADRGLLIPRREDAHDAVGG